MSDCNKPYESENGTDTGIDRNRRESYPHICRGFVKLLELGISPNEIQAWATWQHYEKRKEETSNRIPNVAVLASMFDWYEHDKSNLLSNETALFLEVILSCHKTAILETSVEVDYLAEYIKKNAGRMLLKIGGVFSRMVVSYEIEHNRAGTVSFRVYNS